jgi:hypothetical protein
LEVAADKTLAAVRSSKDFGTLRMNSLSRLNRQSISPEQAIYSGANSELVESEQGFRESPIKPLKALAGTSVLDSSAISFGIGEVYPAPAKALLFCEGSKGRSRMWHGTFLFLPVFGEGRVGSLVRHARS